MKVAPGKAAEAAARGETPPNPPSFFPSVLARLWRAKTEGKKATIIVRPLPRAALRFARGYNHVVPTGLQRGSPRSHNRRTIGSANGRSWIQLRRFPVQVPHGAHFTP